MNREDHHHAAEVRARAANPQLRRLSGHDVHALLALVTEGELKTRHVNWLRVLDAARRHRLAALVTPRLSSIDLSHEAHIRLEETASETGALRASAMCGFAELVDTAQRQGIAFLIVKGPALSQALYGDPQARTYMDLDIIVHPENLARAEVMLVSLGYELVLLHRRDLRWMLGQRAEGDQAECLGEEETRRLFLTYHFHLPFVPTDPSRAVRLDLHWALFRQSAPQIPTAQLWQRAVQMTIAGRSVLTLSPIDNLIYLCQHASQSSYRGLKIINLLDIIKAGDEFTDAQWQEFIALVRASGLEGLVLRAFGLSYRCFSRPLPDPIRDMQMPFWSRIALGIITPRALAAGNAPCAEAAWELMCGEPRRLVITRMLRQSVRKCLLRLGIVKASPQDWRRH
jgi:hypothetical protein